MRAGGLKPHTPPLEVKRKGEDVRGERRKKKREEEEGVPELLGLALPLLTDVLLLQLCSLPAARRCWT